MSFMDRGTTRHVRLPGWQWLRITSLGVYLGLCAGLIVSPAGGLFIFWRLVVPVLPLLFFLAPGVWRNVCPLAAANQAPRLFKFTRSWTPPRLLRERGYLVAITCFLAIVPTRKVLFNANGRALALLLAAVIVAAFSGGL